MNRLRLFLILAMVYLGVAFLFHLVNTIDAIINILS